MAAIVANDASLIKCGEASDVKFGTPYVEGFIVVESVQATNSYQSTGGFKNEVGITVGQYYTDPKMEVTITGVAEEQVKDLGEVTQLANFVANTVGGGGGGTGASSTDVMITSVKQDSSNEDFMRFELTGERWLEVDPNTKSEVSQAEFS